MDERIKAYDVKMTKSYNNLLEEFGAIRAGRAIRTYWIVSP